MNEEVINKTENEELKGQLLNLFKEEKIELDPEISDVFNEVFDEFDLANGEEDSVNIYFKEDKDVCGRSGSVRYGASGLSYADGGECAQKHVGTRLVLY